MEKKIYAGKSVDLNEEGYFTDPFQWSPEIAAEIASEEGVNLTEKHLRLIEFIREEFLKGTSLSIRRIGNSGIVDIKGFYDLFPGGPLKKASRIAGIPKPTSCI